MSEAVTKSVFLQRKKKDIILLYNQSNARMGDTLILWRWSKKHEILEAQQFPRTNEKKQHTHIKKTGKLMGASTFVDRQRAASPTTRTEGTSRNRVSARHIRKYRRIYSGAFALIELYGSSSALIAMEVGGQAAQQPQPKKSTEFNFKRMRQKKFHQACTMCMYIRAVCMNASSQKQS